MAGVFGGGAVGGPMGALTLSPLMNRGSNNLRGDSSAMDLPIALAASGQMSLEDLYAFEMQSDYDRLTGDTLRKVQEANKEAFEKLRDKNAAKYKFSIA